MGLCMEAYGADAELEESGIFQERSSGTLMAAAQPLFDICLHDMSKT